MTPAVATETEQTSTGDAFRDAYEAARATHAPAAEDTAADESVETAEPDAETGGDAEAEATPAPAAKTQATESGLISDEEFTSLQTTHASDPAALRKALEGTFTQKTQKLAEQRKSLERLQQYVPIIDAYETDAESAIEALAKQHGLVVTRPGETQPAATESKTTATAGSQASALVDVFKARLGPELEYLADGLAPAITELVERLTETTGVKAVEPFKRQLDILVDKAAQEQTTTLMQTFEQTHPDWKTHEAAMFDMSQRIEIKPGAMTELEFLDHLYSTVTAPQRAEIAKKDVDKRVADQVKAALAKMQKGAASAETPLTATPEHQVRKGPPSEAPSFQECYEAAKRDERW